MDISSIDYKKWLWAFAVIGLYVIFMIIVVVYGLRDRTRLGEYGRSGVNVVQPDPEVAWEQPRITHKGGIELANCSKPNESTPSRGVLQKLRR
jgi:hypothetical protein